MRSGIATILKAVSRLRGNEKLEFLAKVRDDKSLQEVVRAALDPYVSYPITMNDCPPLGEDPNSVELQTMHQVLDGMNLGLFTTTEAEAAVQALSEEYPRVVPIFYRILGRNLRCGIGIATAKKVWDGLIPEFEAAQIGSDLSGCDLPIAAEYNYAGHRLFAVMNEGLITIFNNKGRAMRRLPALRLELDELARGLEEDYVFEGILVSKDGLGKLIDRDAVFYIYDWVPAFLWKERGTTDSFEYRCELLSALISAYRTNKSRSILRKSHMVVVERERELQYLYLDSLNHGYEGLVLKDLGAPYGFGVKSSLVRWNPNEVVVATVVEVQGKQELTALKVSYNDSMGWVRYGFATDEREDLWKDQEKLVGRKVRLLVQPSGRKLRFARYLGLCRA